MKNSFVTSSVTSALAESIAPIALTGTAPNCLSRRRVGVSASDFVLPDAQEITTGPAFIAQQGFYYDKDLRWHYIRQRWYDPMTKQFISSDPLGFGAGDANLYRYTGNNSVSREDPSGLHVFVLPSNQTNTAGPVVAEALQKIVGKHATLYAEANISRQKNGRIIINYWEIKYKDENAAIHDPADGPWTRIKSAIDMWHDIDIYLQDKSKGKSKAAIDDGSTNADTSGGIAHPEVAVNYKNLTEHPQMIGGQRGTPNLFLADGTLNAKIGNLVKDPFAIVLYHEAFGHALGYILGEAGWDATHDNFTIPYDPILKLENEARKAYEYNTGEIIGERNHQS